MNWKPPEGQPAGQMTDGWQATRTDSGGGLSYGSKWLIAIVLVLAVSIPVGVMVDTSADGAVDRPRQRSVTELVREECPSQTTCGIDLDRIGDSYTFTVYPDATAAGYRALGVWAGATGCIEDVDVARIGQTRALDGMVESANGRSTWTFHPDDGLTVVCSP